jgi:hypothetical protein
MLLETSPKCGVSEFLGFLKGKSVAVIFDRLARFQRKSGAFGLEDVMQARQAETRGGKGLRQETGGRGSADADAGACGSFHRRAGQGGASRGEGEVASPPEPL